MRAAIKEQRLVMLGVIARKIKQCGIVRRRIKTVSFFELCVKALVPVAAVARAEAKMAIAKHCDDLTEVRLDNVGKKRPHGAYIL